MSPIPLPPGEGSGVRASIDNVAFTAAHASPSVRKFARELGVPLEEVKGTGPKGRITQDDVQAFTKSVMAGETRTKAAAAKAPRSARSSPPGGRVGERLEAPSPVPRAPIRGMDQGSRA